MPTSTPICGRTFRGAKLQRFRYSPSGQHYYLTQTKSGKTTIYVRMTPKLLKSGAYLEQWRKLSNAQEQADAINDIASMYSTDPSFTQFFPAP